MLMHLLVYFETYFEQWLVSVPVNPTDSSDISST